MADDSSQTKMSAGTSPPPLCTVGSEEKEDRTPCRLLFVIRQTEQVFYSSHVQEQPVSFIPGVVRVMSFHLLQSCLAPATSWERGHPTAATPGAHDSLSVARLDDLPQQGVLRQMRKVKIMPAHPACLSATRQKSKPCTVFSESPWQGISRCHAAQETRERESCDPVTIVSLAQIFQLRSKIKRKKNKKPN